jgi:hypothetical protein
LVSTKNEINVCYDCVPAAFQPPVRQRHAAKLGIIRQGQAPLFLASAVGRFPFFGFQRATKLLAALFDQGIIPAV